MKKYIICYAMLIILFLFASCSNKSDSSSIPPIHTNTPITSTPSKDCPSGNLEIEIPDPEDLPIEKDAFESEMIDILNSGGADRLIDQYSHSFPDNGFAAMDFTGNDIPEIFISRGIALYGFGCIDARYTLILFTEAYEYLPGIISTQDMNQNNIPDLVVGKRTCHSCIGAQIFEWDGEEFRSLIKNTPFRRTDIDYTTDVAELLGFGHIEISDTDSDGTYELVLSGGIPGYSAGQIGGDGHWREQVVIYTWNGENYIFLSHSYSKPVFRYEAVQDGDAAFETGDYITALSFYEDAINNEDLASWSYAEWKTLVMQNEHNNLPDAGKMPFNPVEYQQLTAYAKYRMIVIYVIQGQLQSAEELNEELQTSILEYPFGQPYAEMASTFLDSYKASNSLEFSCKAVIDYVTEHPAILSPLGNTEESFEFGYWSRTYEPNSICTVDSK